jgi:hypothetical protein
VSTKPSRNRFKNASDQLTAERCRRDAHYFVFRSGLVTKDEHDQQNPTKPFPETLYLQSLLDCLLVASHRLPPASARWATEAGHSAAWLTAMSTSGLFFCEKSRQVMVTWLCCAFLLWLAKYHPHQLCLVQSKREDDAAALVFTKDPFFGRISFMETHLPQALRTLVFPKAGAYGHLYFPNGSHVWAIPEGGDIIRSQTPSIVFSDEAAFQPEFGQAITAALPAIKGGGAFVGVSSAEPGAFAELVEAA